MPGLVPRPARAPVATLVAVIACVIFGGREWFALSRSRWLDRFGAKR